MNGSSAGFIGLGNSVESGYVEKLDASPLFLAKYTISQFTSLVVYKSGWVFFKEVGPNQDLQTIDEF